MAKEKVGKNDLMDKLVSLCKRRGFIFQSSEIYGGINSCWDYGPLGVELKRNVKEEWWRAMTFEHDDIEGLDASILMHPKVWEASGHVAGFTDPLVDCKKCKARYRADKLFSYLTSNQKEKVADKYVDKLNSIGEIGIGGEVLKQKISGLQRKDQRKIIAEYLENEPIEANDIAKFAIETEVFKCPTCGNPAKENFTEPRLFNLMFKTFMGPVEDDANIVYLRPETAQGIYVNFLNVQQSSRRKIPFGIAQIGKAFRNEITPGNFIFRTREFEQMEMQFFVKPGTDMEWFEKWKADRIKWYERIGIRKEKLRFHQHEKHELAHYARAAFDIEFEFPFGWQELEGIHNRGDFDLSRHKEYSGKDTSYYDDQTKEKYIPYIIETSAGADRTTLVVLTNAYNEENVISEETGKEEIRVVMKFHPRIAPIKSAIFPLVNRDNMPEVAHKIYKMLHPHFKVFYDDAGSIGRRYRRQDEAGTPFCLTVDSETLQNETVTLRDRDSMKQIRVKIDDLVKIIGEKIKE
jgi:glycyl-tRNA synthetase